MNSSPKLNFQLQPEPVDYFKLEEDYFKPHCNVTKEVIVLSAGEKYIEYPKHFPNLDLDKKETVVLNFPVGKGKTTLCYDLIKEYDKKGWYIIVCSPFIKLVEKDTKEAIKKVSLPPVKVGTLEVAREKVCTYLDFKNADDEGIQVAYKFWPEVCNVHIMTINCLLGNPGNNALDQSVIKSSYINDLLKATEGKKVVLFIDELHESVHNFESSFIANLLRWTGRVQKAFIASATFTPATIPAIKAVSLLTDRNVHIYESDRSKNQLLADIHLHIIPSNSFSNRFLNVIDGQIQQFKEKKAINILTGLKHQANEIAKKSFKYVIDSEKEIGKYPEHESVHLLTSETELNFQDGKNNIGTTFKTGSNITSKNSVLFIVLPTITNGINSPHYGIFTDGIPSIIQSMGRLRNGGEIHIFTTEPNLTIDQANTNYPVEFSGQINSNYYQQNVGYSIVTKEYISKVSNLQNEIATIENDILSHQHSNKSTEDRKNDLAFWYPNIHEFLLDKSQKILVQGFPSFGKYISPYIIWACLKDQFQNAKLKEIIYHQPSINKITITPNNQRSVIEDILRSLSNEIKNQTFRSFVDQFSKHLKQREDENGDLFQNEYVFNEKGVFSNKLMKYQTGFTKEIFEKVIFIKTGKECSLLKRKYFMACLSDIQKGAVHAEIKIREAYRQLLELRDKYLNWFNKKIIQKDGKNYIPAKLYSQLPSDIFHEAHKVFSLLKKHDPLVGNKIISVLQNLKDEETDSNRKRICTELDELFILRSDTRKMIEGAQYYELPKDYIQKPENSYQIPLL